MSRAHFYSDAVRDVYVRLPNEENKAKQPSVCGKLRKTMYGSLDAAQRWRASRSSLEDLRIFPRRGITVHFFPQRLGDDALRLLRDAYELSKGATLGPESSQSQSASFLGSTPTLRQLGIE